MENLQDRALLRGISRSLPRLISPKLHKLISICIILAVFLNGSLSLSIATPVKEIAECYHLSIEEEGQVNYFTGAHDQPCCLCSKGMYMDRECNITFPNSTICKACQFDDVKQSYVDFEPHNQKECTDQTDFKCGGNQVKVDGSPSSPAKCKCPDGTVPADRGLWCESIPGYQSTAGAIHTPSTQEMSTMVETSSPPPSTMKPVELTTSENGPESDITTPSDGASSDGDVTSKLQVQETTTYTNGTSDDNYEQLQLPTPVVIVLSVGGFAIVAILVYCSCKDKIQQMVSTMWDGAGSCCSSSNRTIVYQGIEESMAGLLSPDKKVPLVIEEPSGVFTGPLPIKKEDEPSDPAQPASISEHEKQLREEACEEMAGVIIEKDLCQVGRDLLPKPMEFEDIFDDKRINDRTEKARRIFERAIQIKSNLALSDLRDKVEGLGYLRDIIDEKKKLLTGVGD